MKIEPARLNRTELQQSQESQAVSRQRFARPDTVQSAGDTGPALEIGQEINAVVVSLENDRVLLNAGGMLIEADDPGGGLAPGQSLRLRVESLDPQILLRVIEQEATIAAAAAHLLRARLPGLNAQHLTLPALLEMLATAEFSLQADNSPANVEKLKTFIAEILNDARTLTPESLMRLTHDGGLQYEAKLFAALSSSDPVAALHAENDFKRLLLGALAELDSGSGAAESRQAIAAELNHTEVQQIVNLLAQLDGQPVNLRIPFFAANAFTEVAVAVERDGGQNGSRDKRPRGFGIMLLLDLEDFGRTRIDAYLAGRDLRVAFYVDREESVALLRNELPAFASTLQALGYREVLLSARASRYLSEEQEHKFRALAVGLSPNIHLLDVNA